MDRFENTDNWYIEDCDHDRALHKKIISEDCDHNHTPHKNVLFFRTAS